MKELIVRFQRNRNNYFSYELEVGSVVCFEDLNSMFDIANKLNGKIDAIIAARTQIKEQRKTEKKKRVSSKNTTNTILLQRH